MTREEGLGGISIVSANVNSGSKPDILLGVGGARHFLAVLINDGSCSPSHALGSDAPEPGTGRRAPAAGGLRLDGRERGYLVPHPDRQLAGLLRPARRRPDGDGVPVHSSHACRAAGWWRVRGINSAGTAGAWSSVRRFTPQAAASSPALTAIALNPTSVVGGNASQGTVRLTSAASAGGFAVSLSSSSTVATIPASVSVAHWAKR